MSVHIMITVMKLLKSHLYFQNKLNLYYQNIYCDASNEYYSFIF